MAVILLLKRSVLKSKNSMFFLPGVVGRESSMPHRQKFLRPPPDFRLTPLYDGVIVTLPKEEKVDRLPNVYEKIED